MSFLSQLFDSIFAPAAASDPSSDAYFSSSDESDVVNILDVNPATGFPILDPISNVDILGNPWGVDLAHHHDHFSPSYESTFSHDCGSAFDSGMSSSFTSCGTDWP